MPCRARRAARAPLEGRPALALEAALEEAGPEVAREGLEVVHLATRGAGGEAAPRCREAPHVVLEPGVEGARGLARPAPRSQPAGQRLEGVGLGRGEGLVEAHLPELALATGLHGLGPRAAEPDAQGRAQVAAQDVREALLRRTPLLRRRAGRG